VCKLDDAQLYRLAAELDRGPAAQDGADWADDQRWTLARVAALIHRLFGVAYTQRGVSYLLHRIGWTPHVPARRAVERDEDAIAA
jgi:transposase